MENKTLIIAEIGNNHNGSIDRAIKLIDAAKNSGADIAKFQLRHFEALYRTSTVEDLGVEYAKDIIKKYELEKEIHFELASYCKKVEIEYMCTPWDVKSVDMLEKIGVRRYKVASADFDNLELLRRISETFKPVILSTGMNTFAEIKKVIKILNNKSVDFTLLHCNSTYPAPFFDIDLNYINKLKTLTPRVGYSGHERGIAVSIAAVAMGAMVIERHITVDKNLEGPDHKASLLPHEFVQLVRGIREVEQAMTKKDESLKLSQGAKLNKESLGKSIIAASDISAGTVLTRDLIDVKSPGQGLSPLFIDQVLDKKVNKNISEGSFIFLDDLTKEIKPFRHKMNEFRWGIPVRPHDIMQLHSKFDSPVYEFHISYSDLDRNALPNGLSKLSNKKFIVHAPELFADSRLLNLCSIDPKDRELSIMNMAKVIKFSQKVKKITHQIDKIKIVANVGGFSTDNFLELNEREQLYKNYINSLQLLDLSDVEILPQNMAPFPWHFGGQRYQNIFMDVDEIVEFCRVTQSKFCLDTSHLSMYCCYADINFNDAFQKLLPYAGHIHLADAQGSNGEGVFLGTGDIDFSFIKSALSEDSTFIFETWQGHKNMGSGFQKEVEFFSAIQGRSI